jgi:hypothetical protein
MSGAALGHCFISGRFLSFPYRDAFHSKRQEVHSLSKLTWTVDEIITKRKMGSNDD